MSVLLYKLRQILEREHERIFLWFPVVFALGILGYFSLKFEPVIWWSLVAIEGFIIAAYLWRAEPHKLSIIAWLSVFCLGFINIQLRAYHLQHIPLLQTEQLLYLKGYVDKSGYNYRGKKYIILDHMQDFDGHVIEGRYKITVLRPDQSLEAGQCVEMVADMRPLMLPSIAEGFQFNRQQYFQGLKAIGYSDVSVNQIDCQDIGVHPEFFVPFLERVRSKIVKHIDLVLPQQSAGIAAAIIAGERGRISQQQTAEYRDAGLAHFLAISGLHMGMIAGLMFFIIRWIAACFPTFALRYDTKKIAAVFAILMSFIYLLISGGQISAQRAFLMTFLVLLGIVFGRKAISMRMIAWVALFILILEPQVLLSASFQMSFAAVVMLVAFYEVFQGKFQTHFQNRFVKILGGIFFYLIGIVIADLVASLATLPFVIYHFNRISLYTSVANFLAGPVIGLWIMPCVLLSLLLMPFGLDKYALLMTGKGIDLVNQIAQYVSHLDNASYQVLSMPAWGLFIIVLGGLWLAIWKNKWRHWGWLLIGLGFCSVLCVKMPDLIADNTHETFALKTNQGKMVILPNRGNYFTKQMWQEKLALAPLNEEDEEKLKRIYKGKLIDKDWLNLVCDSDSCLYQDKVKIYKDGGLVIEGRKSLNQEAVAIYSLNYKPIIQFISDIVGHRYWTIYPIQPRVVEK